MANGLDQKDGAAVPAKHPSFLSVFPSIMLPMFLAVVDQTIVATALPAIASATGEVERASWIVVGYLIATTVAAPIYGRLGDSFGRKRVMFVALTVFMIASVLCAASPTILTLTLSRILQGLGGGGLMTLSQALVGETIPPRERARYQGYLAAVAVCANTFGPVAGGYLTEHFGWQSIFLVNLPIGIGGMVLATKLPPPRGERLAWKSDPGGLAYFAIFVATTLLALEQLQQVDLAQLPTGAALLVVGVIALVLLVRHERRAESPLIPLKLLRMPAIWRSDAMAVCHGAALVSLITFVPIFLEVVRGASPSETGLLLVPLTIGIGVGSLLTGRLVSRTGYLTIFPIGGLILTTATLLVLAFWAPQLSNINISIVLMLNGLFMGPVMGVVQVIVQNAAGGQRLGEAAASVQFSRSMGAAFGTALVGAVLFAYLALSNPEAARVFAAMVRHLGGGATPISPAELQAVHGDIVAAFRAAFLLIALFTTTGCVLAWTNPQRRI